MYHIFQGINFCYVISTQHYMCGNTLAKQQQKCGDNTEISQQNKEH